MPRAQASRAERRDAVGDGVGEGAVVGVGGSGVGAGAAVVAVGGIGVVAGDAVGARGRVVGTGARVDVAAGTGVADGVAIGVDFGPVVDAIGVTVVVAKAGCRVGGVTLAPESPEPPEPTAPGVTASLASVICTAGVGVAVTITVTYMTIGVAVRVGTVIVVGAAAGTVFGGTGSEPQAVSASSATRAGIIVPTRGLLVTVSRVIMPRVVVLCVRRALLVTMSRVESWTARMDRMVITKRDTFKIAGGAADIIGLAKGHIVRWFTFEDEIRRLVR